MKEAKIALRVVDGAYGLTVLSSDEIIKKHINKANSSGKVWYSTNILVNSKNIPYLKEILLFDEQTAYSADIIRIEVDKVTKEKIVPSSAEEYSDAIFASEPKNVWFLLTNFTKMTDEDLKDLIANDGISVYDKIKNPGRINRFYYRKCA